MNIDELESTLPNGLHDALISAYPFVGRRPRFEVVSPDSSPAVT